MHLLQEANNADNLTRGRENNQVVLLQGETNWLTAVTQNALVHSEIRSTGNWQKRMVKSLNFIFSQDSLNTLISGRHTQKEGSMCVITIWKRQSTRTLVPPPTLIGYKYKAERNSLREKVRRKSNCVGEKGLRGETRGVWRRGGTEHFALANFCHPGECGSQIGVFFRRRRCRLIRCRENGSQLYHGVSVPDLF